MSGIERSKSGSAAVDPDDFNTIVDAISALQSGGSQTVVRGPFTFGPADFAAGWDEPNGLSDLTLWTPAAAPALIAQVIAVVPTPWTGQGLNDFFLWSDDFPMSDNSTGGFGQVIADNANAGTQIAVPTQSPLDNKPVVGVLLPSTAPVKVRLSAQVDVPYTFDAGELIVYLVTFA